MPNQIGLLPCGEIIVGFAQGRKQRHDSAGKRTSNEFTDCLSPEIQIRYKPLDQGKGEAHKT